MRRLAALACVALAVSLSGCGSDSESDDSADAGQPTTSTTSDSPKAGSGKKPGTSKKDGKSEDKKKAEDKPDEAAPHGRPTLEKAVKRVSGAKLQRFLHKALDPLLKRNGIPSSDLALSDGRKTLTITVKPGEACDAQTTDEEAISQTVREILTFVDNVVIVVEGGQGFAAYVASNCNRAQLPSGSGRVVLEEKGNGVLNTKPFRISAKRWTVEYAHNSDFFSIFVGKGASGKKYERETVISQGPGSGKKTYKGPGTFRLSINGAGDWTVRVREQG